MTARRLAFALAGLGGNNAYGAGFLAAAQRLQADRDSGSGAVGGATVDNLRGVRASRGILPELEFISCTSGAIATTAEYLRGEDLQTRLQARIAEVDRLIPLPRTEWAAPWRAPAVALATGVPNVFGPWREAFGEHLWRRWTGFFTPGSPLFGAIPTAVNELLDLWLPARSFVPELPDRFFTDTAATFTDDSHGVGVCFNSFDPTTGSEHLYVNAAGLALIREHHDPRAEYGRSNDRLVYQPITPEAVRNALWLFSYGFPDDTPGLGHHVDGAYVRSIILNELTFADRIYAVKPVNHRWIGPLPRNALEVQDMQTELWMGISYREQASHIDIFNRLLQADRIRPAAPGTDSTTGTKRYHRVEVIPVEIAMQRGFFTYFVEDFDVYREAYAQARDALRILDQPADNSAAQMWQAEAEPEPMAARIPA